MKCELMRCSTSTAGFCLTVLTRDAFTVRTAASMDGHNKTEVASCITTARSGHSIGHCVRPSLIASFVGELTYQLGKNHFTRRLNDYMYGKS